MALAERHIDEVTGRFGEHLVRLREEQPSLAATVRSRVDLTVELNDTSRLHTILFSECPRTPALDDRLDRFSDLLTTEVAWHLERTGNGGVDATLRARLVIAAVDAAVHEVILTASPGPARVTATDELVALTVRSPHPS